MQGASNPRAGEGAADAESLLAASGRLPDALRHRRQALTARDFEAIAREATPAVAVARAQRTTDASGLSRPGAVMVVIVPRSSEPEPQPTFELRRQVREAIAARVPAGLASGIHVVGPKYFRIGVEAHVVPTDQNEGAMILARAADALARFLHPLHGGRDGCGWPFGRDMYSSDFARLLERLSGVDHVRYLTLCAAGIAQGVQVRVPGDCLVSAGPMRLELAGTD